MDECKRHSEDEEGEIVSDFEEDFTEELSNYPHILQFIHKLHDHIKRQRKKIKKLRNKLVEQVCIYIYIYSWLNSRLLYTLSCIKFTLIIHL